MPLLSSYGSASTRGFGQFSASQGPSLPELPITTNLLSWHAADYAPSLTSSSGRVSQWDDLSGNGNHLYQSTGSLQPSISTLGSMDALSFGSRQYCMYYSSEITFNAHTIFLAMTINEAVSSSSTPNDILYPVASNVSEGGLRIGGNFSAAFSGEVSTWWHFSSNNFRINGYANTTTRASGFLYIMSLNWNNSSTAQFRVSNSALSLTTASSTGGYTGGGFDSANSPKNIKFIGGRGVSTPALNGIIGEIIVYNSALTSGQVDSVYSYLSERWS